MNSRPKSTVRKAGADDWLERQRALERFSEWEAKHPRKPTPEAALSGVALLYELLPAEARSRKIETRGVQAMQRALSVLAGEA